MFGRKVLEIGGGFFTVEGKAVGGRYRLLVSKLEALERRLLYIIEESQISSEKDVSENPPCPALFPTWRG